MWDPRTISKLTIITGHYGSGKTNFSLNLAFDLVQAGNKVTLVDLDIVNPYFRTSDFRDSITQRGVRIIMPRFAGTTLDVPSLPAEIYAAFEAEGYVIFDVGGDDAGATALGRYREQVEASPYDMLYVINYYRNLTQTAEEAVDILAEIQRTSGLVATGIVNNSHLQDETDERTIAEALPFARATAAQTGLPLVCTTIPAILENHILSEEEQTPTPAGSWRSFAGEALYPVHRYVHVPWEEAF